MNKGTYLKSGLDLHHQDDETESQCSTVENYGDPAMDTTVGHFMHNLFENQLYTDVEFGFKSTKECLYAHRVVLAAKCEYFADLLFGEKSNKVSGMKMRVDISNVTFSVFKDIVNYFYTDDIDFPDLSTVLDVYATAKSFKVDSLIWVCEQYLDELELTEDNACSTLQISNSRSADYLKNRCIDFIKKHALEVISSPDFEKCSFNTVREISNIQDLNLRSESEMLEAVTRWINVQPDHAKADLKKSLMKCIRFLDFSPKEFHGVIKQHPELLTGAEALDTLMYLNDPTPKNMKELPDWMNRSRRTFSQGLKDRKLNNSGKIEIPLTTASTDGQKKLDRLTSFLQLKCVEGDHKIKSATIKLESVSKKGKRVAKILVKASVVETGFYISFIKTITSKEAVISFKNGIWVNSGHTFDLEVELTTYQPCSFFQYDISKEDNYANEHFQSCISSKPEQGRRYFLHEVLYKPMP